VKRKVNGRDEEHMLMHSGLESKYILWRGSSTPDMTYVDTDGLLALYAHHDKPTPTVSFVKLN